MPLAKVQRMLNNRHHTTAAICSRALLGLFSPNLIDQSACEMGLVLACVFRILHDDWSTRLGESRRDRVVHGISILE